MAPRLLISTFRNVLPLLLPPRAQLTSLQLRQFGSTSSDLFPNPETISQKAQSMLDRLKASLAEDHSAQYEAVQEEGLRMLVFGKPGSGKVSCYPRGDM
jgi:hypothetical protein